MPGHVLGCLASSFGLAFGCLAHDNARHYSTSGAWAVAADTHVDLTHWVLPSGLRAFLGTWPTMMASIGIVEFGLLPTMPHHVPLMGL